jgi:hypothetical protein
MNTKLLHSFENVFTGRPNGVINHQQVQHVRQDKRAFSRARTATNQPASLGKAMRAHQLNTKNSRSQKRHSSKRQTEQVTLWVKPIVKAELQRKAAQEGLSVSAVGAALLEQSLQQTIDMSYGPLLIPVIKQTIRQELQRMINRIAWLLVKIAVDTGQIKGIDTAILGRQKGVTEELLKTILANASKSAKVNLSQKTPEMLELMEELAILLRTGAEEDTPHE